MGKFSKGSALTSTKSGLSRKLRRKLERKEKKARKGEFISKKYGKINSTVDTKDVDEATKDLKSKNEKPKKKPKKDSTTRIRKKQLLQANKEEERNIKSLAKKLKLVRRKNQKKLPKSFDEDGLGYILEVLDHPEAEDSANFNLSDADSDINDDLPLVLAKNRKKKMEEDSSNSDQSDQGTSDFSDTEMNASTSKDTHMEDLESDDDANVDDFFISEPESLTGIASSFHESKTSDSESDINSESDDFDQSNNDMLPESNLLSSEFEEKTKKKVSWSDIQNKEQLPKINLDNTKRKKIEKALGKKKKKISIEFEYEADEINEKDEELEVTEDGQDNEEMRDEFWEDIYGRTRDKKGNVITKKEKDQCETKYVPPAKRAQMAPIDSKKKAALALLKKHLKGLFNRLSESNMKFIADQIEDMFMKHSRNDMNQTITTIITEAVVSPPVTPERLIMEHALLISLLHANVGTEVGAHCLQAFVTLLDERVKTGGNYGEGKEMDNLLLLICHLYTFKITHNSLIFDIVHFLADTFTEKDVELILLILRSVGFGLRKDNPLALKEMILSLQSKASNTTALLDQSRVRFMVEALMAIRNNNMNKLPNYDPSLSEHLKKFLRNLLRKGSYMQELHISLSDLLKANERGRWWVVGSAWQGLKENQTEQINSNVTTTPLLVTGGFSDKIVELARKQRMNTETRKNIFCIIMSAEDFMDAFEKLLHLGLKNQQEREIIHVIVDCVMQEKKFNPYYAYLSEKFCQFDRRFQMTLQFALWDKFKELRNLDSQHVSNLAQFLVLQFSKGALPLSILKVIQLSEMEKALVKFLRQIMLALLLHQTEDVCAKVFGRIAGAPKLQMLREGLRLFMHHFLLRNGNKMDTDIAKKLKERVEIVETILLEKRK